MNEGILVQARKQGAGSTDVRQAEADEASTKIWGCSSAGRAPALQAGGQEFDSPHLHHTKAKAKVKEYNSYSKIVP